jgi:hypothetical protein
MYGIPHGRGANLLMYNTAKVTPAPTSWSAVFDDASRYKGPSAAAGSVFTFSLSLGDYITVQIVGGRTQLIGNLVYSHIDLDLPMAAALGTVPVAVIVLYLLAIRRTGALDNL